MRIVQLGNKLFSYELFVATKQNHIVKFLKITILVLSPSEKHSFVSVYSLSFVIFLYMTYVQQVTIFTNTDYVSIK